MKLTIKEFLKTMWSILKNEETLNNKVEALTTLVKENKKLTKNEFLWLDINLTIHNQLAKYLKPTETKEVEHDRYYVASGKTFRLDEPKTIFKKWAWDNCVSIYFKNYIPEEDSDEPIFKIEAETEKAIKFISNNQKFSFWVPKTQIIRIEDINTYNQLGYKDKYNKYDWSEDILNLFQEVKNLLK